MIFIGKYMDIRLALLMVFLSCSINSFGYIYQAFVMKKTIKISSGDSHEQLVFGIGDYHDKHHQANQEQRNYLESMIKRFHYGKVIVEDLGSVNNDGKGMCCNYMMNIGRGILSSFADVARSYAIDVDNIEYRYCRVVALGPLLNNLKADPYTISSAASVPLSALKDEAVNEVDALQKYNDGYFLNGMYRSTAHSIRKMFKQLKLDRSFSGNESVADYCNQWPKKLYRENLEKLCIFDSAVLDMKILHSLVTSPEKQVIIIIAGGSHIETIRETLVRIGYEKIMGFADSAVKHVETALGSESSTKKIDTAPPALDMHLLDQFIQ